MSKKKQPVLNRKQRDFVEGAKEVLSEEGGFGTLQGPAGTGKTTTLSVLNEEVPGIVFLTPTHKAREVLQRKLGENAAVMTTTSFTKGYKGTRIEWLEEKLAGAVKRKDSSAVADLEKKIKRVVNEGRAQEPMFGPRSKTDETEITRIIVDEASMTDVETRDLIMEMAHSCIFVGDGFQLPPATGDPRDDWFYRAKHDWKLTQVVRQAANSGVLLLANLIRDTEEVFPLAKWMRKNEDDFEDLFIMEEDSRCHDECYGEDAVMLSYMNAVVDEFCYAVRRKQGFERDTMLRNDRLYCSNNFGECKNKDEVRVSRKTIVDRDIMALTVENITRGTKEPVMVNTARLRSRMEDRERRRALSNEGLVIRYDYARTVHSSQGSEWPVVLYKDRGTGRLDDITHNRLLYTAVTRASEVFALLK